MPARFKFKSACYQVLYTRSIYNTKFTLVLIGGVWKSLKLVKTSLSLVTGLELDTGYAQRRLRIWLKYTYLACRYSKTTRFYINFKKPMSWSQNSFGDPLIPPDSVTYNLHHNIQCYYGETPAGHTIREWWEGSRTSFFTTAVSFISPSASSAAAAWLASTSLAGLSE